MTSRLYASYHICQPTNHPSEPEIQTPLQEIAFAANHLTTLLTVRSWTDPSQIEKENSASVSTTLVNLGHLGSTIAGTIYEAIDILENQGRKEPDLTTSGKTNVIANPTFNRKTEVTR